MEWSIVPLRDGRREIHQYVAIQRDVTSRVEADRRLRARRKPRNVAPIARSHQSRALLLARAWSGSGEQGSPLGHVQRQVLAVLFANIVGFLRASLKRCRQEQVVELLRAIHAWMEQVIFLRTRARSRAISATVLAIFGVPEPGGAMPSGRFPARMSCRSLRGIGTGEVLNLPDIRIGIGLHYGSAVLGDIGTERYVEFAVIGDTVNAASRLQQATRSLSCDLVVSQDLVRAVMDKTKGSEQRALLRRLQHHGDHPRALPGRRSLDVWGWMLTQGAHTIRHDRL